MLNQFVFNNKFYNSEEKGENAGEKLKTGSQIIFHLPNPTHNFLT